MPILYDFIAVTWRDHLYVKVACCNLITAITATAMREPLTHEL